MFLRKKMTAFEKYQSFFNALQNDVGGDVFFAVRDKIKLTVQSAGPVAASQILDHAMALNDRHAVKKWVYACLPALYRKHKVLHSKILKILNDDYAKKNLEIFYSVTLQIASFCENDDDVVGCLDKINLRIGSPENTSFDLQKAYQKLGLYINTNPGQAHYALSLIRKGLENPKNDLASIKEGNEILKQSKQIKSYVLLGKKVAKTKTNLFGWKDVEKINPDEVCVLVLPGEYATEARRSNAYLSDIEELFKKYQIDKKIGLYGVVYRFGTSFDSYIARQNQMIKYHRLKDRPFNFEPENVDPNYVDDIFEKVFKDRIVGPNEKKLSLNKAISNIRKVNIFAHCHGAYTFLKLEEKLCSELDKFQYSKKEQQEIMSNLLCIAYAPSAPLGVSKSQMISVVSTWDQVVEQYNTAELLIRKKAWQHKIKPSFLTGKKGNIFVVPAITECSDDHNYHGFNYDRKDLAVSGKAAIRLMGNALISGIQSAVEHTYLPDIESLVTLNKKDSEALFDFNTFRQNGEELWKEIIQDAREESKKNKLLPFKKNKMFEM